MGRIPDDLPIGVRMAVILLRIFSYGCGIALAFITLGVVVTLVTTATASGTPLWVFDLTLMGLAALATGCYAINLLAGSLEAAHSHPAEKEPLAAQRVVRKIAADLLNGLCFVMIVGGLVAAFRMSPATDPRNLEALVGHGVAAVAARVGARRIENRSEKTVMPDNRSRTSTTTSHGKDFR